MANKLTLTVPRRLILIGRQIASKTAEARPVLQHVCIRKEGRNRLVLCATTGHILARMTGGNSAGRWPKSKEVLVHFEDLPPRKAISMLDDDVTFELNGNGVSIDDGRGFVREKLDPNPGKYPDYDQVMGQMDLPIAPNELRVDTDKLGWLIEIGKLFTPSTANHAASLAFRRDKPGKTYMDPGMPVVTLRNEWGGMSLAAMLMGLRN